MDAAKSKEFEEVKHAILKRCNINEETYRQRFRNTKKKIDESYVETEVRLKDLAAKWLKPTERTKEGLVNVIIREQLVNAMPKELQLRVRERKPRHWQMILFRRGIAYLMLMTASENVWIVENWVI